MKLSIAIVYNLPLFFLSCKIYLFDSVFDASNISLLIIQLKKIMNIIYHCTFCVCVFLKKTALIYLYSSDSVHTMHTDPSYVRVYITI